MFAQEQLYGFKKARAWWWDLAKEKQIELLGIQPGKPAQNTYIEHFNRTFREDVLNAYLFDYLDEVGLIAEHWLEDYNTIRPQEALQGLSPR